MIFAGLAIVVFLLVVLPRLARGSSRGRRGAGGYDGSSYSCSTPDSGGGHHSHSCGGDSSCNSSSCGSSCGGGGD